MSGKVVFIGAGPGAADLITLRGASRLAQADVVLFDALTDPALRDFAPKAKWVDVGKRCGRHSTAQRFINKRLVDAAARHDVVVRLKGGDPMLFGRAHEEMDALDAAGTDYEVVPGVTAAFGAAADLALSLTRRGLSRSVAFVTPRVGEDESASDWAAVAVAADTAALYMGVGEAEAIAATLIRRGRPAATPVAIVESASLPDSRVAYGTLGELPELAATVTAGPALILLGEVLRERVEALERDAAAEARVA